MKCLVGILLVLLLSVVGAEAVDLLSSTVTIQVVGVNMDFVNNTITILIRPSAGGEVTQVVYGPSTTPTGQAIMSGINTCSNCGTVSVHRRLMQQLQTDGKLPAGSYSGTPY